MGIVMISLLLRVAPLGIALSALMVVTLSFMLPSRQIVVYYPHPDANAAAWGRHGDSTSPSDPVKGCGMTGAERSYEVRI